MWIVDERDAMILLNISMSRGNDQRFRPSACGAAASANSPGDPDAVGARSRGSVSDPRRA